MDLEKIEEITSAIELGDAGRVTALLNEYPDLINYKAQIRGDSLLHLAAYYGQSEVIPILVERGLSLTDLNSLECTPFMEAIRYSKHEAACVLLDFGADPNAPWTEDVEDERTTLHVAATRTGAHDLIVQLVKKGAEVDSIMKGNLTPLCAAAQWGIFENIRVLLMLGANPEHKTDFETTPEQLARPDRDCAQLIRTWAHARRADQAVQDAVTDETLQTGIRPLGFQLSANR